MSKNSNEDNWDVANVEFNKAFEFVQHAKGIVYVTGRAGTGKTTFLKYLKKRLSRNTSILAPTGVAAINAGGQTIHSFFKIPPSVYVPGDKRLRKSAISTDIDRSTVYEWFRYTDQRITLIENLEVLIIDEVSMVRCDLLDVIDQLLRIYRRKESEPFGGVKVVLIGDTFQLPPIADFEHWKILSEFYPSPYFFSARVINESKPIFMELKKVYRQKEQDFIDLLNRVRINKVTAGDMDVINSKYNPHFVPDKNDNYITLATHNITVSKVNSRRLLELTADLMVFEALIEGTFPDKALPTERVLELKVGAQIMFVKNSTSKEYYNGMIGKIKALFENKIVVSLSDNRELVVEREVWRNIRYSWNEVEKRIEEESIGTFTQFPLRLAWAITVHKSQGLTFDNVIADLGAAFTPGQVYVALSRCRSFGGLVLRTRLDRKSIFTDPVVVEFAQSEIQSISVNTERTIREADFYYMRAREEIRSRDFAEVYKNLLIAIKYRNDIETKIFERYFITTAMRIAHVKWSSSSNSAAAGPSNTDISGLTESVSNGIPEKARYEKKISSLEKSIERLRQKLKNQDKRAAGIKHQKDENALKAAADSDAKIQTAHEEFSAIIEEKQREIDALCSRIQELEMAISANNMLVSKLKFNHDEKELKATELEFRVGEYKDALKLSRVKLTDLESKYAEILQELNGLKGLKWYQKFFGSK
jgi:hypothetical protein